MSPETGRQNRTIEITRVFDAPRELVFKMWTEPEHFVQWWGPNGFTTPVCNLDQRPGGKAFYCMHSPEGGDTWCTGTYREVVPPERIVMTDSFADAAGNVVPASTYGMTDWPDEALITVAFEDLGGRTRLTLKHEVGAPAPEMADGAEQGWSESFDRLAAHLASAQTS